MSDKPIVVILGGTGFIGRNLVKYLVDNNLCSHIRVVDKVLPQTAFLGKIHADAFANPIVEFRQGNLNSPASIEKCFQFESGKISYVFNLAAETRYSQSDDVYKEKIVDVAVKCAKQAAASDIVRFVEVSTAQVYEGSKKQADESGKLDPWTSQARYKLQAENELKSILGDKLVVVRPAIVYGPGDYAGVAPRLICGAVYKHLGETMKFLWGKDLRINTVHVRDVCKALWLVATKAKGGEVYNLADKSDTTQGSLNKVAVEPIFGIKTDFYGSIMSNLANAKGMKSIAEDVNEKHLKPWSELLKRDGIVNSPLTPYLDAELLYNNSLSVDGSKIESLGFAYEHPQVTLELIREELAYFQEQNLFPKV